MNAKRVFATVAAVLLIAGFSTQPSVASAKAGGKCSKTGVTSGSGASKLTCQKAKGKKGLAWVRTPESTVGTARNPVPLGTAFRIGGLEYSITSIKTNADAEICAGNGFNEGCDFDDNLKSIVDPNSTISWTTVQVEVTNKANAILQPAGFDKQFYLVLSNGQLLEAELFVAFPASLSEVQVIPGGSGSGSVAFAVPKSGSSVSNLLVIRDRSDVFKERDYYFRIK